MHDRALTLHGGGQGFESPRLHSRNHVFAGRTEDLQSNLSAVLKNRPTPF